MKLKKKQSHKKTGGKNPSQLGLPRLTRHSRHETGFKKIRLPKERPSEKDQS